MPSVTVAQAETNGLSLSYRHYNPRQFENSVWDLRRSETRVSGDYSLWEKSDSSSLNIVGQYKNGRISMTEPLIDEIETHHFQAGVRWSKTIRSGCEFWSELKFGLDSDLENASIHHTNLSGYMHMRFAKSDSFNWVVGGTYTAAFFGTTVLPVAGFIYKHPTFDIEFLPLQLINFALKYREHWKLRATWQIDPYYASLGPTANGSGNSIYDFTETFPLAPWRSGLIIEYQPRLFLMLFAGPGFQNSSNLTQLVSSDGLFFNGIYSGKLSGSYTIEAGLVLRPLKTR
jgi:hypothetical protein